MDWQSGRAIATGLTNIAKAIIFLAASNTGSSFEWVVKEGMKQIQNIE